MSTSLTFQALSGLHPHSHSDLKVPWEKDRAVIDGTPVSPAQDLRYYSRGLFNHPIITRLDGVRGKASVSFLHVPSGSFDGCNWAGA
eukprot:1148290-Pelagomonas_calceolata.AAC.1